MRRFFRVKLTPPTLAREGVKAHAEKKPKEYWNEPDVRGLLYATFGYVCGYCGADVSKTRGEVDHYRPEGAVHEDKTHGGYWWLAYAFDNYVLACETCNGPSYKGTHFPLLCGTHATYEQKEAVEKEARGLLHPCEDKDIDRALCVNIDETLLPVRKGPDVTGDLDLRTDKFLEIFDKFELYCYFKGRQAVYNSVFEWLESGKFELIRRAASRYSPHSQVARAILLIRKTPLPTPDEELGWLTEELIDKLLYYSILCGEKNSELQRRAAQRDREELRYALAALLIAPPQGSPDTVRQILEQNELMEEIQKYIDKLRKVPTDKQSPTQDSLPAESD